MYFLSSILLYSTIEYRKEMNFIMFFVFKYPFNTSSIHPLYLPLVFSVHSTESILDKHYSSWLVLFPGGTGHSHHQCWCWTLQGHAQCNATWQKVAGTSEVTHFWSRRGVWGMLPYSILYSAERKQDFEPLLNSLMPARHFIYCTL